MSKFAGMSNITYHPYSDFALHHMGSRLSDGIKQGAAGPDQFRTAPLWGLGQRIFFLHDGRLPICCRQYRPTLRTDQKPTT